MKIQKIIQNRLFIYVLGISVGVVISFGSFSIYTSLKAQNMESSIQDKVVNIKKTEKFIDSNKDFIVAGLLLSQDNKAKLDDKMSQMPKKDAQEISTYVQMKVNPLYKEAGFDYLKQVFKHLNLDNFKDSLTLLIKNKVDALLSKIFIFFKNTLEPYKSIDKEFLVNKMSNSITKYLYENIDFNKKEFLQKIKDNIAKYLNENISIDIDKSKILDEIKIALANYLDENIEVDKSKILNIIKVSITNYLDENININIDFDKILKKIKDSVLNFIINSDLYDDISRLLNNIHYMFSDKDNDYHFGLVNIGTTTVDLSFLNILDIYIDPVTAIYDNGGTPFKFDDDLLMIKDMYINLEALNGKGIDIVIGQVNIYGKPSYFIYNFLGVINAQI